MCVYYSIKGDSGIKAICADTLGHEASNSLQNHCLSPAFRDCQFLSTKVKREHFFLNGGFYSTKFIGAFKVCSFVYLFPVVIPCPFMYLKVPLEVAQI